MKNNPTEGRDREDVKKDLTQPEKEEPRGVTDEDMSESMVREIPTIEADETPTVVRPGEGLLTQLMYVLMFVVSVVVVGIYFLQDQYPEIRSVFAIIMGIFVGLLILAAIVYIVYYFLTREEEEKDVSDRTDITHYLADDSSMGIVSIDIDQPFVQYKATTVNLRVRNISDNDGIRVRFHSMDHISPESIDLAISPNEEQDIKIELVPIAVGEREMSIEFADLFDSAGKLIPKFEADARLIEKFRFVAREPALGGITASQVRFMKTIISVATALVVGSSFIVAFFGEALGGFEQIIKSYMPMLIIFQVPVFYVYFTLMNRLPS